MLNASVDMLNHLGHQTYADAIAKAIRQTVSEDGIHTPGMFQMVLFWGNSLDFDYFLLFAFRLGW